MNEIHVITPVGMFGSNKYDTELDRFLRIFAEAHKEYKGQWAEKYGVDYEDDVFMMHPFCWCEKDDCLWCGGEIEPELFREMDLSDHHGPAPNFWYKPLDFKVWWYKYIGRGMDTNISLTKGEFNQMLIDSELY